MSYHKKNLKEKLVEVAWNICVAESWEKVNMREGKILIIIFQVTEPIT